MYGSVTFPGVCVVWGLIVMVMVYSVGHISGAHFNPAVTVTFAIFRHFPYKQVGLHHIYSLFLSPLPLIYERASHQVPLYMVAQLLGSLLASGTLSLLFNVTDEAYFGTIPVGPDIRSFVTEIIISFLLMFVISGVATDNRAVSRQSLLVD